MTTRALLHSLLVCHPPLSTTWLVCFLSLIYFFLHGTSFKKQKKNSKKKKEEEDEANFGIVSHYFEHTNTHKICSNCTDERTVRGRKHHEHLHYTHMGVTSFGQSLLKWFWWCRYVIRNATPSRAMQHNFLTGCSDISEHWLKLSLRSSSEWRWLKVENQLQSKLTPCLSYWLLLRLPIKEGAKSTMLLPSMVQSAFPDWVHRNVEFSLQLFSFFFQWEWANTCQPSAVWL